MNTKNLMMASSALMGITGIAAVFIPKEIANAMAIPAAEGISLCIQILGALYLGFAIMNWMAKGVLIGGIYSRPLSMGNFLHFTIGGIVLLIKGINDPTLIYIWVTASVYLIFAILFWMVLNTSPKKK
jgi:hypothetical protein